MALLTEDQKSAVRDIPLSLVCERLGLTFDKTDKQYKDMPNKMFGIATKLDGSYKDFKGSGKLSANGGAISLVMHVKDCKFGEAVGWLSEHFISGRITASIVNHVQRNSEAFQRQISKDRPPIQIDDVPQNWAKARAYLINERCISASTVDMLRQAGKLQSDKFSNVVMVAHDNEGRQRLADVRSSHDLGNVFKGLAKGSNRDYCFNLQLGEKCDTVIIFESSIDLMSWYDIQKAKSTLPDNTLLIATSGKRPTVPAFMRNVVSRCKLAIVNFDNDKPGNDAANELMVNIGVTKCTREVPPDGAKDWNKWLQLSSNHEVENSTHKPDIEQPVLDAQHTEIYSGPRM